MTTLFDGDVHAGLSRLDLEEESFELGDGISLSKTYANLMAPFLLAFKRPASPGSHHRGQIKAASGSSGFDVDADLMIPGHIEEQYGSRLAVAKTIVFLLRLGVNPATTMPVLANLPFSTLEQAQADQTKIIPFEVQPRHFQLAIDRDKASATAIEWVKERWQVTHKLSAQSGDFALAVEAIDAGQFVENSALTLVSLWGALEVLFAKSRSEITFRLSSLMAAYLEPPGSGRADLKKKIAKLYGKRSDAAHGKPKHRPDDLLDTFSLLRRVLLAIIDAGEVPSKGHLEDLLFGVDQ